MLDRERIEGAVRTIIEAIGEDQTREGLVETPRRIAEMYVELFEGLGQDPREVLQVTFEAEKHQEMVVLKDIPFYSMCEHHFLPFHGVAHIGYIPEGALVGISKLARAVEILARRPQLQERLTTQIADAIMEVLEPQGVGIVIEAEHLCMTMRGIRKPGSIVVTSANRGLFRRRMATRQEFLTLIGYQGRISS
jgi:GTP cyclohydrolase I